MHAATHIHTTLESARFDTIHIISI